MFNKILRRLEGREYLKKVIGNISWLTIEKIFQSILGLFIIAWVARYLGPENFGIMNYAIAYVALFATFSRLGLTGIVVRNIVNHPSNKEKYLGSAFILKVFGSFLVIILSLLSIFIVEPGNNQMALFVFIISLGVLFRSFDVIEYWFQSQVKSKYTAFSRSFSFGIVSMIKVLLILSNAPLVWFVMTYLIENAISAIFLIIYYIRKEKTSIFNWEIKVVTVKNLLKDSWPLILSGVAVALYMRIDQVMIGSMLDSTQLGIYSAAVMLSESWYFIPGIIAGSVFPAILEAKKKSERLYLNRLQMLYTFFTWFTIPIALLITILSPYIINTLYGSEYSAAATVLSIHIWAGVFVFLGSASGKYLIAENHTKVAFYRTLLGLLVNIILNIILIPVYGIVGAAISTLVSYCFAAYISNSIFKKTRIIFIMQTKSFNLLRFLSGNNEKNN